jgi:hypothetical protein
VRAVGGYPDEVVHVASGREPIEPRDLLSDVLLECHHCYGLGDLVGAVDREFNPPLLDRVEPNRRSDVELGRQGAWFTERCLVDDRGAIAASLDCVAEPLDRRAVDGLGKEFLYGSRVLSGGAKGKVEVGAEPPCIASVGLAEGGASLEHEVLEETCLFEVSEKEVLRNVDQRRGPALGSVRRVTGK